MHCTRSGSLAVYRVVVDKEVGYVTEVKSFFFQAEDGIRDKLVTGVQTCVFFFQAEDGIRDKLVTGVHVCSSDLTAGPAFSAATCPVITKIPAPMTAPMPSVTRLRGPSARVRACSPVASASARSVAIGLVAKRLIRQSGSCRRRSQRRWDDRDCERDERR